MSDSAAWKQVGGVPGASFVNGRIVYDKAIRDWMAANWIFPQTWMTGVEQPKLPESDLTPYLDVIDNFTTNERSKLMGLTKDHKYTDNDGDYIEAEHDAGAPGDVLAFIKTSADGVYVNEEFSVPLALNVLGYDRAGVDDGTCAKVGTYFATGHPIRSSQDRDELLAKAIANLKSIDLYDQRADERKAAEEAKKAHDAKLEADLAVASADLREWSQITSDFGVSAIRAEKLAEAVAKYKVAFYAHAGV